MTLSIIEGREAQDLVRNAAFRAQWQRLHESCPWATAYQGPGFVGAWYETYKDRYRPLIVFESSDPGTLTGFIPLAVETTSGRMVAAGAHQCEYQGWLAVPPNGQSFIQNVLTQLARETDQTFLSIKYVPPGTLMDWVGSSSSGPLVCEYRRHARPIIRLGDGGEVADYLHKKKSRRSTKNYWNRLKRIGELRLEQVSSPHQLEAIFDELIAFYDTRQGAANNSVPFQDDAQKKQFYIALLQCPGLLHVTLLKAGDKIISALFGVADRTTYSLAMPMFSPVYADYSPVTLHFLMLVERLHQQGYLVLDLTPGGDPFKERFANDHDYVHTLSLCLKRIEWIRRRVIQGGEEVARRSLRLVRIEPKAASEQWKRVARIPASAWPSVLKGKLSSLAQRVWSTRELRIYALKREEALRLEHSRLMSRDDLASLLAFQPTEAWQTRQGFLSEALKNIEVGHHFYVRVENGRLQHIGWLIEHQKENQFPEVGQAFEFPSGTAVLYGFYTDPRSRGRGLYNAALRQMAHDAAELPHVKCVYVAVMADNKPSRHVIEKLGFHFRGCMFQSMKFNRAYRWSDLHPQGQTSAGEDVAAAPSQD